MKSCILRIPALVFSILLVAFLASCASAPSSDAGSEGISTAGYSMPAPIPMPGHEILGLYETVNPDMFHVALFLFEDGYFVEVIIDLDTEEIWGDTGVYRYNPDTRQVDLLYDDITDEYNYSGVFDEGFEYLDCEGEFFARQLDGDGIQQDVPLYSILDTYFLPEVDENGNEKITGITLYDDYTFDLEAASAASDESYATNGTFEYSPKSGFIRFYIDELGMTFSGAIDAEMGVLISLDGFYVSSRTVEAMQ